MAKQDYVPARDTDAAAFLTHVAAEVPNHFGPLGLTAATPEVVAQHADAVAFAFAVAQQLRLVAVGQAATSAKNRLRDGDASDPNVLVDIAFAAAPAVIPPSVKPGVVKRLRDFATFVKGRPGYTEAIGTALRIVGSEHASPDFTTLAPQLTLRLDGTRVEVVWDWRGHSAALDAIEIHVDRGDGKGFAFLAVDSKPNYLDTQAFPSPPARWKYKAIYRKDDGRVGQWSTVTEINVGA